MNQDKSIFLQKQIRDNSEDLQKELLDLKNWEQEMKRKEADLLGSRDEQMRTLPPVRKGKKKKIDDYPPIASTSKEDASDRIKSSDYTAWDKFDVDAACRKLDDEEEESDGSVEDVQESAEKKHAEATKFKELGNRFVQKKSFKDAIESYTEAIKLFPYDEVFYANRALCYLKIDNLYSAEADCTAALQLNDCYVKAYHRRATARIGLEEYLAAKEDINRLLYLDPANKEGKSMLAQVNRRLEKSVIISGSTSSESPLGKKTPERIWNTAKLKEQTAIQKQQALEIQKVKESSKATRMEITEIFDETEEKLPDWLPKLDGKFSTVKPVELSPHQRSTKPLRRIPVKEVDLGNDLLKYEKENSKKVERSKDDKSKDTEVAKPKGNHTKIEVIGSETSVQKSRESDEHSSPEKGTGLKKPPNILAKLIQEKNQKEIEKETSKIQESAKKIGSNMQENSKILDEKVEKQKPIVEVLSSAVEVPPAPKTSVQFLMDWKRNKSLDFRYSYLKQIQPEVIPTMFKDSMESDILGDIIKVLKEKFTPENTNIFQYLEQLSNVKRFRTLIMFIERSTKEALKELFLHCRSVEGKSEEEIDELRRKYEV